MPTLTVTIDVNGQGMALHTALPDGDGPFPGIVVIQHAPGVDEFLHVMVGRLAEAGFAAAAPDLYHRQDPTVASAMEKMKLLRDREIIADVNATVEFLRAHPAIAPERLGITGFCMGGRVVYLMAAANPSFRAAVAYYGGNIMVPWDEDENAPFSRTSEIDCPLMFHFGADDTNPSPEDMRKLDDALTSHGKPHEFHVYQGAGHAFMNFTNAERYREDASTLSWPRTLQFFRRHIVEG
ncbi:MAG: dienelactone hydrolase family protein [Gammaproteobacteria bacterium]|nr:dienelactone hydrolase family protein [Gammaproteobacteria bacterium]